MMQTAFPYRALDGGTCYMPDGHRAGYAQEVREAMALLDRAAEGQQVPDYLIAKALRTTGDATEWAQ